MSRVLLVCGPTGVGKTTYSIELASQIGAVRFSIDPWMQTLFAKDMQALDFDWMMERVNRCYDQMWSVCEQILALDGNVVLDLGFTERASRQDFVERAGAVSVMAELHYLDAPTDVRRERVRKRNLERDPAVYAFEVTEQMFAFMEPRFEVPDAAELQGGRTVIA